MKIHIYIPDVKKNKIVYFVENYMGLEKLTLGKATKVQNANTTCSVPWGS